MPKWIKLCLRIFTGLAIIFTFLFVSVRAITFHPPDVQSESVTCADHPPLLQPGQLIKIQTYNVQYMAGKNYVFFYDLPGDTGPDERPSPEDITQTIHEVARIIREEAPDIILLQEIDDGSKRTDYEDQLARLMELLPPAYACHTATFYWQAAFVPHPQIRGAVGQKLAIIAKYRIDEATRYQLPLSPLNPLTQQFYYKRALLEAKLPIAGNQELVVLNTHLEVSTQGTAVKQQEIAHIDRHLSQLNRAADLWILGGDFNLLPPGQYGKLHDDQQATYRPQTELTPLFKKYQAIPGPTDVNQRDYTPWFTALPNNPAITHPDRTIDYIFFADSITRIDAYVRQADTRHISDHLPVIAELKLP